MRDRYDALDARTKQFAIQVILFAKEIESLPVLRLLVKQLVRAATSVAANQPAALRPRLRLLVIEAHELTAIYAKGRATVRARLNGI